MPFAARFLHRRPGETMWECSLEMTAKFQNEAAAQDYLLRLNTESKLEWSMQECLPNDIDYPE